MTRKEQLRSKGEEVVIISPPVIPGKPGGVSNQAASSSGIIAWMFPSWSTTTATDSSSNESQVLDEAILDDMRTFGRDALLARCVFNLKQGAFILQRNRKNFLGTFQTHLPI